MLSCFEYKNLTSPALNLFGSWKFLRKQIPRKNLWESCPGPWICFPSISVLPLSISSVSGSWRQLMSFCHAYLLRWIVTFWHYKAKLVPFLNYFPETVGKLITKKLLWLFQNGRGIFSLKIRSWVAV